ncbi:MAG: NEW3 domain-containing protein, partial [Armatimonadota bacterium]
AERRGAEAEGTGLPRNLDEQPFVLLRRLPHSATVAEPGMMVFSGDEHHLLAAVPGETSLRFDAEGLLVVSNGTTGELVRGLEEPPAAEFTAPEGEGFIVGWARFDEGETAAALAGVEPGLREPVMKLAERLAGLASAVPQARMRELAAASGQFVEIADGMNETPGALSPISPLIRLHERLNALVVAHLGMRVDLQADHRWLAPEVEKPLRLLVQSGTQEEVSLAAVGHWRAGNFAIQQPAEPQVVEDTRVYQASVRLDDGLYVERVVPIIATATVRRGPLAWTVSDILRLEANRPYQLIYEKEPLTLLGGAERSASIQVRNWSPLDLELSLSGSGPEGWQVAPAERRIQAPALSDASFDVAVHAPEGAARGRYDVRVVANHAAGEDSAFIAQLPVSVLDALQPLLPDAQEWERPEAEQRARIRNSSKFAVYAEEGETIGASIENIRVTRYEHTLTWRLVDPALTMVDHGRIAVDESAKVEHAAEVAGTYYLEVVPGSGSADVRFANRLVAEVATKQDPLQLFTSAITRHFFVPEGAEQFRLGAQDGGAAEGARFVITAPGGRVAFERDGNYNGVEWPVRVEDGEAGKLWQLRVEPRQDIAFWLAGDVMPYLSTSPERALRVEGR